MNFLFYIIFSLAVFSLVLIGNKKYFSTTLYALAIGGVVNANFFHAGNYPIMCFGIPFGIDSIIYTLFVFCVILMFIKEGKRQAYILAISSIIAIMFSATMQLISDLFTNGSSLEIWKTFFVFCASSLASVIAIFIMIKILEKIKNKINHYATVIVGITTVSIIDTLIYYSMAILIYGMPSNMSIYILTSFIGKLIALICGLLTLRLFNLINSVKKSKD